MDQPHSHGALPHRGGDSLDRATARVASGEYARQARLQGIRAPLNTFPDDSIERGVIQRLPRQDKAALVEVDGPSQPAGVGLGTDEDEECPRLKGPTLTRAVVLDHDPLKAILPGEFSYLGIGEQLDV